MGSIGVFDSGYGGLSILEKLQNKLPDYNYTYLGDNARAPYGTRSFETIYEYTKQAVFHLFEQDCPLVIVACNTASARALRTIQQKDLPLHHPNKRVLGIIRPVVEEAHNFSPNQELGLLATKGTVVSRSYELELEHHQPQIKLYSQACPMWVPLVENQAWKEAGGLFFLQQSVKELLQQCPSLKSILLGCTHYPFLKESLQQLFPSLQFIEQGEIVANKLENYLERHPEISIKLNKNSTIQALTSENASIFTQKAQEYTPLTLPSRHLDWKSI